MRRADGALADDPAEVVGDLAARPGEPLDLVM
jgi:hypothetical protein